MRYDEPLIEGVLIRRYKRFLADVILADGSKHTVHCANPGSMKACSEPGRPVLLSKSSRKERKLRHTLEMIRMGRTWVGINTARPNAWVAELIRLGKISELRDYGAIRREVTVGEEARSRIDLLLSDPDGERRDCYVEIKNATYRVGDFAAFPDAVTERGRKHLRELIALVEAGQRAVMFFFVGRADCRRLRPADEIDPAYGETLRAAVAAGVEVLAYKARFSLRGVALVGRLPIEL